MNFFRYAYLENRWLWFHILAGGILTRVGLFFFQNYLSGSYARHWSFVSVLLIALLWETAEYLWINRKPASTADSRRFFMDAFGDVSGALAASLIILL